MTEEVQNKTRQRMVGRVVSTARAKTVAVLVE